MLGACAPKHETTTPRPVSGQTEMVVDTAIKWTGDEDLAPILVRPELTPDVMAAAERVEMRLGNSDFIDHLSIVAEDSTAPWLVRINALRLLANRGAAGELPVFAALLHDPDERVRI